MGLSRTISEKMAISVENCKFPQPVFLKSPLTGFSLEFCNSDGAQKN